MGFDSRQSDEHDNDEGRGREQRRRNHKRHVKPPSEPRRRKDQEDEWGSDWDD